MYNAKYVIAAIIVFVAIFTAPFWVGIGADAYKRPSVVLPKDEKECIESTAYMRAEHMQLLNVWRDEALRNDRRVYVSSTGKKWEVSLQNTCMKCHNDAVAFCDKCHISNSVYPYCWTCHIAPKGNK